MKRPKLHILFDGLARVYDWTDADALFESLETELLYTRRALERLRTNAQYIFDKRAVRDWAETLAEVDEVLGRERTEEIKGRLGE